MHHALCRLLLEPCNTSHPPTQHTVEKKRKKEEKKMRRLLSLYILRPNELYMCVCMHSAQWWMNIFFPSFFTTIKASKRTYERTKRREKKCRILVGWLEARIEKNVIWSLSCRPKWLMIDVKKRKTPERGVQKRWTWPLLNRKILIGSFDFRSRVCLFV
jgi:hypothetical protein